jgi:hypothetical protein
MLEKGGSAVCKWQKEEDEELFLRTFNAAFLCMLNDIRALIQKDTKGNGCDPLHRITSGLL